MATDQPYSEHTISPLLVVLSGPSGVGKDAVLSSMREKKAPYHFAVTATTRIKRPGEVDGQHYIFLTPERFDQMVEHGEFLEWAQVYGNRYGLPRSQVLEAMERGQDTIVKTDVQGAATLKLIAPDAVFIFLTLPSLDALEPRLRQRKTEGDVDLELRLRTARAEMGQLPMFDYVVVNREGALDETVANIEAILLAEKNRYPSRQVDL